MLGIKRIKRAYRNVQRLVKPVGAILIYHRIVDLPHDPHNLAVSPENFARHLEYIRGKYTPISLSCAAEGMQRPGSLPHRWVVITFDDGYADNYRNAWPLLEQYQVPATIFVISGSINSPREFWWDDLERILLRHQVLPERLSLRFDGHARNWLMTTPGQRQDAFQNIHQALRGLSFEEREQALLDLCRWAGIDGNGRPENLPMRDSEIWAMAQSQFVEIGAHTRTHPALSTQLAEVQSAEIIAGRLELERVLGKPVMTFSYPFGNSQDFTKTTVEHVKSAGFQAAVTTIQGAVEAGDDRYQLKRCEVNNWDIEKFPKKLDSFFYA